MIELDSMKAITVWQPWGTCLALGLKKNETRSWPTHYRGPIAIHAAAKNDPTLRELWCDLNMTMASIGHCNFIRKVNTKDIYYLEWHEKYREIICDLEFGKVVGIANLVDCILITPEFVSKLSPQELALGDYTLGRYAWVMEAAIMLDESLPSKGQQRLWNINIDSKYFSNDVVK